VGAYKTLNIKIMHCFSVRSVYVKSIVLGALQLGEDIMFPRSLPSIGINLAYM